MKDNPNPKLKTGCQLLSGLSSLWQHAGNHWNNPIRHIVRSHQVLILYMNSVN